MFKFLKNKIAIVAVLLVTIILLPATVFASVHTASTQADVQIHFSESTGYVFEGVGAELDPHLLRSINTEQGCTEEDWRMVCDRVEAMQLQKIRVMVMPEWYEPNNENNNPAVMDMSAFSWDNEDMASLYKVLDLAERNDIQVNLTLWAAHASKNSWLAVPGCVHWASPPNDLDEWSENFCALLKHLIEEKGYSCVQEITPYNEPNPAYYVKDTSEVNIEDYAEMVLNLHNRLEAEGLRTYVKMNLGDDGGVPSWLLENVQHEQLERVGDCFNSHIYLKQDSKLSAISSSAQSYMQMMQGNTDKAFKINEFGAKYSFADDVSREELYSFERGMLTAKMLTVFLGEGCTSMVQWCLFDQYYGEGAMMHRGLWKYKDQDWEINPVYYALATVTQHTSSGSNVYKGVVSDTQIAGTALESERGWTYLLVNEATDDKTVAIKNAGLQSGEFEVYMYTEDSVPGDGALELPPSGTISMENGIMYCQMPPNSFVVLAQTDLTEKTESNTELLDVSENYWIYTDASSNTGIQENGVLKLRNGYATFVGSKAGSQKITVTFSGQLSATHWAAIQFRGKLTPENATVSTETAYFAEQNNGLALVIKNKGQNISLNAQHQDNIGTPGRLAGDVTGLNLGDGKEHTIEIVTQDLSDGTVDICIYVDGIYQSALHYIAPVAYADAGYVTIAYSSAENNLFIRSVKIEGVGSQYFQSEPTAAICRQGEEFARYDTVQVATELCKKDSYVKLIADSYETVTVNTDMYLDLNGYTLQAVNVTDGILYGMDSKTDDYSCADGYGRIIKLTAEGDGCCASSHYTAGITEKARNYVMIQDGQSVSFHRYYMAIVSRVLRPSKTGVGFKAVFAGDEVIRENMDSFGIELCDREDFAANVKKAVFDSFQAGNTEGKTNTKTAIITNIMKQMGSDGKTTSIEENNEAADTMLYGRPYMIVGGQKLYTSAKPISVCFKAMVNRAVLSATEEQMIELLALYQRFQSVMDTEGWEVEELRAKLAS